MRERNLLFMMLPLLLGILLVHPVLVQPVNAETGHEIGVVGLISTYTKVDVEGRSGTGRVGPEFGPSGGFVLGQTMGDRGRWGGEFRYNYFKNDLKLEGGGQSVEFGAQSHSVHYDVLYYLSDKQSRVRPYVAAGFGVKVYQGTGDEIPFQPLTDLALLTKSSEAMPTGDFGAGVKIQMGDNWYFRIEFRDYISGIPRKVMAPAPGATIDGILHHLAPFIGITWIF